MSLLGTLPTARTATTSVVRQLVSGRRALTTTPLARLALPTATAGPWAERPTSPRLHRYLVVAEDCSDTGANARRFEVRERHLEQAQAGKRSGRIELGGALLKKDFHLIDQDIGPVPHMAGSVLVVLGESIDDVRARVLQDEYVQANVWDLNKLKIYPLLQAPLAPSPDAVASGAAVGAETEAGAQRQNPTLGQLRQDSATGKGPKIVTLGALRRMHHQSVDSAGK